MGGPHPCPGAELPRTAPRDRGAAAAAAARLFLEHFPPVNFRSIHYLAPVRLQGNPSWGGGRSPAGLCGAAPSRGAAGLGGCGQPCPQGGGDPASGMGFGWWAWTWREVCGACGQVDRGVRVGMDGYGWVWMGVGGYRWVFWGMDGYGWVWMGIGGYGWV